MNSRARHFVTGLAGFALNRLRRFRRSGAHPPRFEFRPDSRGKFDELVARFSDGGVFFEDLGENGLFVDIHWNDGTGVRLWAGARRGCLTYNHESDQ